MGWVGRTASLPVQAASAACPTVTTHCRACPPPTHLEQEEALRAALDACLCSEEEEVSVVTEWEVLWRCWCWWCWDGGVVGVCFVCEEAGARGIPIAGQGSCE